MIETNRTLSKNEAKVVLDLEWRAQKSLTAAELRSMLGASDGYARFVAHRLVQKGWLRRVRPGLFQLVAAERGPEGVSDTNPLTVGALLVEPYFFSFGTACTHHGFTEQVFAEVYIACRTAKRPVTIHGARYVFAPVQAERFYGFEHVDALGSRVQMATKERAVLDALDRPHYAGGLREVSRIVGKAAGRLSWDAMVDAATKWNESAAVQRLGYFIDLHHIVLPADVRERLLALVAPQSKLLLGPRAEWGTRGRLVQPWGVVENVPREQLLDAEHDGRRRRSFPKRSV